jgi:hypothetical protein
VLPSVRIAYRNSDAEFERGLNEKEEIEVIKVVIRQNQSERDRQVNVFVNAITKKSMVIFDNEIHI